MRTVFTGHAAEISNTVFWNTDQTGDWSDAADWSTGAAPGASDTVIISARHLAEKYDVIIAKPAEAGLLRINSPDVGVDDGSTLTIGSVLELDAGMFYLDLGSELTGGRIVVGHSANFVALGGTLSHVRFEGSLNDGLDLTIGADTAFSARGSQGPATISAGLGSTLWVLGANRIDNVDISLGGTLISEASGSQAGLLVLGSRVTVNQVNNPDFETAYPTSIIGGANAGIINNGTINAEVANGLLDIDASLLNNGHINLGNGDTICLVGNALGQRLTRLIDSIDNTGGTFALSATVSGGTLDAAVSANGGTLSGVRFEGTLALASPSYDPGDPISGMTITDGTQFLGAGGSGSATVSISNGATLAFTGSDAINHVVFNLSGSIYGGVIDTVDTTSAATTLTLGRQTIVNVQDGFSVLAPVFSAAPLADLIVNDGTINLTGETGSRLLVSLANFENHGKIDLGAGNVLVFEGNSSGDGTLSGTAAQSLIDTVTNTGGAYEFEGDVTGGTVDATVDQETESTSFSAVVFEGTITVGSSYYGSENFDFDSATSFAGAGGAGRATINVVYGSVGCSGSATLSNATINIGNANQYLAGITIIDPASGAGTFTIAASATISQNGAYVGLYSGYAVGSGFVNDGLIDASFASGTFFVDANNFVNAATIDVGNGEALLFEKSGSGEQAIGEYSNTGSIQLGSSSSLSLVSANFTNGAAGSITLDASAGETTTLFGDRNSDFLNDGTLTASGDGLVCLSGVMTNAGLITAGSGTLQFMSGLTNNGTVADSSASLVLNGAVSGTGTLSIGAGAAVSLLGGASSGQTVDFLASGGELSVKSPLAFLGTIAGFGGSDVITLTKTAETGYGFANGVLTVEDGSSTVASLTFAGSYAMQDFSVTTNIHGNTVITYS
jgi:hypothetical protein